GGDGERRGAGGERHRGQSRMGARRGRSAALSARRRARAGPRDRDRPGGRGVARSSARSESRGGGSPRGLDAQHGRDRGSLWPARGHGARVSVAERRLLILSYFYPPLGGGG